MPGGDRETADGTFFCGKYEAQSFVGALSCLYVGQNSDNGFNLVDTPEFRVFRAKCIHQQDLLRHHGITH